MNKSELASIDFLEKIRTKYSADATPPQKQKPDDGGPECAHCENRRWLLSDVGLVPCPECKWVQNRRVQIAEGFGSHNEKANQQTFENFSTRNNASIKAALDEAKRFASDPKGWLVLYGPPGTGKTHLCAAIRNELRKRVIPVAFIRAVDLVSALKATFDRDEDGRSRSSEGYEQRRKRFEELDVLIIDDMGAERATEWTSAEWFTILDARYMNRLPTVISSNLDARDRTAFDSRLVDRWCDTTSGNRAVFVTAPSFRTSKP